MCLRVPAMYVKTTHVQCQRKENEHHVILDKCTAMMNPQLPIGPQK